MREGKNSSAPTAGEGGVLKPWQWKVDWSLVIGFAAMTSFYLLLFTSTSMVSMEMILFDIFLGFAVFVPLLIYGLTHPVAAWKRNNCPAIVLGIGTLSAVLICFVHGAYLTLAGAFGEHRWLLYLHAGSAPLAIIFFFTAWRGGRR